MLLSDFFSPRLSCCLCNKHIINSKSLSLIICALSGKLQGDSMIHSMFYIHLFVLLAVCNTLQFSPISKFKSINTFSILDFSLANNFKNILNDFCPYHLKAKTKNILTHPETKIIYTIKYYWQTGGILLICPQWMYTYIICDLHHESFHLCNS